MSSILEFFSYNKSVLSGAMDIIVVKQQDESYKISPFRIRFGSFKVFKAKEKIVNILLNGQKCDLTMRLSECGEAYFMTEIKKVSTHNDMILDGYSSPVDIGNSAPSSPKRKLDPIHNLLNNEIVNPVPKQKEYVDLTATTELTNSVENHCSNNLNNEIDKIIVDHDNLEIDKLTISSGNYDKIDFDGFIPRKLSMDVFSRDKNRICHEISFMIENYYIDSNSNQNIRSLLTMNVELSNSWNTLSKGKGRIDNNLEEIFKNNKISKEEFFKDPWKVLNNGNLAIRYGDQVYTWKVIAPIIFSQLAFKEELPSSVMSSLTQQQQGYFLWKRVNMDAFKIDIKKNLQNISRDISPNKSIQNSPKINPIKPLDGKTVVQYKKTYTLSNEQIKSLNLKPGKNEISFIVSSSYQGTHILTSDIYLWNWDDKILISDLDGTITRSDVLGHLLPFIGKDWSHRGVVKLFNDIDRNGYKILYLTARAICQSSQTKNYLRSTLVQNNIKLPLGPILMSPDGLVSSFKREVIDRIPQSFKIECLTQIVNLFPEDTKPFYAGFGNKQTDAIAYEAVGLSKSKIFIINEKGEISQYNNYYRTSYSQINDLVSEMFPLVKGSNTYFCSLNYFKPNIGKYDIKSLDL